ncbi:hypothetical protein [Brucella abortus]|nr:hypothetical protein [Brucella abortus]
MTTYLVQAQLGDRFEDLYVQARSEREALAKARRLTTLKHHFTNFVI